MADDGKVSFSLAMEIVDVISKFHYTAGPVHLIKLERVRSDIAHTVVLFLSGRAENIYPVEPGVHTPGEIQEFDRKRRLLEREGRGADDDVRERGWIFSEGLRKR